MLHLNIRPRRGFTFHPHSSLERSKTAPSLQVILSQKPKPIENNGKWVWWVYKISQITYRQGADNNLQSMDYPQSFSKIIGTPAFFKQYATHPPPLFQINVGFRIRIELHIKSEKLGANIE